ncbi:MAG: type I-U CRISPR-associated protein Csb2, partial [Firmicutes bacterium]|nr:type I-U CRISPR-associated protein Csb2 [Bacillota bacterium]
GSWAPLHLACPLPDRLRELDTLFLRGIPSREGTAVQWVPYRQADSSVLPGPTASHPVALLFLERLEGPAWDPAQAYPLAHQLRRAILRRWPDPVPVWILGHGAGPDTPRLAIHPLFDVGHDHADGHALGFLLTWPRSVPQAEQHQLRQVVRALTRLTLPNGSWILRARDPREPVPARPRWGLTPERWSGPSRRWTTVTPALLDAVPKPRQPEAAWRRLFRHAGLPEPLLAVAHPLPRLPGAVPARQTRLPTHYRPPLIATHLTLEFAEPVSGPLAVGRGRFLGLGLLAPCPTTR